MANPGNQTVNFVIKSRWDPDDLNKKLWHVLPKGVYHGLNPTIVSDTEVEFDAPGQFLIRDDSNNHTGCFQTAEKVTVTADPTAPYFVAGWQYDGTEDNYAYFDVRAQNNIASHEIKLARATFDNNDDLDQLFTVVPDDRLEIHLLREDIDFDPDAYMKQDKYDSQPTDDCVDCARNADFATEAGDADTVDGFNALQLLGDAGGSIVDLRRIEKTANQDQTDFTIDQFDPKREEELVFSEGPFVNKGSTLDYTRDDPEGTIQNSSRNDDGADYTIRQSEVELDGNNDTKIPVVENVDDDTVDGEMLLERSNNAHSIVDVDTVNNVFVLSGDVTSEVGKVILKFNTGREDGEIISIIILTFIGDRIGQIAVSGNDGNLDYIVNKLVEGSNITLTEENDGGDEQLKISGSSPGRLSYAADVRPEKDMNFVDQFNLSEDIYGIFIKPDGTRLFAGDNSSNAILEYAFQTPWSASTLTFVSSHPGVSTSPSNFGTHAPRWVTFSPDGTKMYMDNTPTFSDYVEEYTLDPAWDPSARTLESNFKLGIENNQGVHLEENGNYLFVLGGPGNGPGNEVVKYEFGTQFTLSTLSQTNERLDFSGDMPSGTTRAGGVTFSDNGKTVYITVHDRGLPVYMLIYTLDVAYDLTTETLFQTIDMTKFSNHENLSGLHIVDNDSRIYFYERDNDFIGQHDISDKTGKLIPNGKVTEQSLKTEGFETQQPIIQNGTLNKVTVHHQDDYSTENADLEIIKNGNIVSTQTLNGGQNAVEILDNLGISVSKKDKLSLGVAKNGGPVRASALIDQ